MGGSAAADSVELGIFEELGAINLKNKTMKSFRYLIFLLLIFGCSNEQEKKLEVKHLKLLSIEEVKSELLPMKIQFGAIGKGYGLPPSIININTDSVRITTRRQQYFSIPIEDTDYIENLQKFNISEFQDSIHYVKRMSRDGGFMLISNKLGSRKFSNTFSKISDVKYIVPDTIGLSKFKNLYSISTAILMKFRNQKN